MMNDVHQTLNMEKTRLKLEDQTIKGINIIDTIDTFILNFIVILITRLNKLN